jgi:hypothetical protein
MAQLPDRQFGRRLEISVRTPATPAGSWKGRPMWVFDGEQWTTDEGVSESEVKRDENRQRWEEMMPELQVIEIPLPAKSNYVPPFPLPLP